MITEEKRWLGLIIVTHGSSGGQKLDDFIPLEY